MKFHSEIITINQWRPELDYIQSIIDVHFRLAPIAADITVHYDNIPLQFGWDGITTIWSAGDYIFRAEAHIRSKLQDQTYIFLHEVGGHALGLDHHGSTLEETLMIDADTGNHYSRATFDAIKEYTHGDVLDLWARYGVSSQYTGNIVGDTRNNTLFGGRGVNDPLDNGEALFGMAGDDLIYGNGGNDTIYGGIGVVDPNDTADTIYGGAGNDLILGNGGDDILYGNEGVDTIYGGVGADTIYADAGDVILGLTSDDTVIFV